MACLAMDLERYDVHVCKICGEQFYLRNSPMVQVCSRRECVIEHVRISHGKHNLARTDGKTGRVGDRKHRSEFPRPLSLTTRRLKVLVKIDREKNGPIPDYWRPKKRADCESFSRPCPFVGCKFNLYLDVLKTGSIKLNFPHIEPWDMPPHASCALDVADELGEVFLDDVGVFMNFTKERARKYVVAAMDALRASDAGVVLDWGG